GHFITKWGIEGSGDGEFQCPYGIAVDSSGNVFVADEGNTRIQKFDSDGHFIIKWGSRGTGDGEFFWPHGIAVDSSGNVYVADANNNRIQKFDSDGTFITKWGSEGTGDGEFFWPHGIAVDSSGNVYVADSNNHRIQKFTIYRVPEIPPFAITIISPEEGVTYKTTSVDLTYIITEPTRWVGYSMDGAENITISGNTTLKKLTNGPHNLTIYAELLTGNTESNTVFFAVSAIAPTISNVTVSPTYALPGDSIKITAEVFDHSGIRWVIASVTKGQEELGNIWLSPRDTEEDIYTGTWDIPFFDEGGIYNITIYATDTEGNEATAEPQRVEVPTDTKAPVITNIAVSPTYAVSGTLIFISAKVTDHLSGVKDVKGIVSEDGEEVSTVPLLDPEEDGIYTGTWHTTIFTVGGIYNIELSATDNSDNEASADAHAVRIVRDTEGPIVRIISPEEGVAYPATEIALEVAADVVIANWSYSLNGDAPVSFTPNTTLTAREGSNSLAVSAEDMTGNVSSSAVSFLVDTTPPVITCHPDVTVEQETSEGTVVPLDVTVSDLCDPDPEVTSNERDIYPPGTTTVTFTATDASGNSASCSVNVIIIPVCEGPINSNGGPWLFHGEGYWIDMDITTPATKVSTKPQDYTGIEDLIRVQPGETVRVKAIVDYSGYTESPDCIMFQRVFPSWEPSTVLAELYTGQLPADLMEKTITFIAPTEPGEYKLHLNFVTAYNPPGDYCDGNIVETTLIVEPELRIIDYQSRVIKGQINLFNVTIGNLGK
ncbi:MAG: 6-bladed beta-propeller, partial [Methanophagales archaeon]|nr:6-bladed beta-propeller [Methanophagales archaeon]